MGIKFANNVSTALSSAATASDTSLLVTSTAGMPTLADGDYFLLTLDSVTAVEIVKVTAWTGTTLTVARAQEGTVAKTFAAGTKVEMRLTAGSIPTKLSDLNDDIGPLIALTALQTINGVDDTELLTELQTIRGI